MPKEIGGLRLYDAEELSGILKISIKSLNGYFRTGKIQGRKIGKTWHTTEAQLRAFMEEGQK